MMRDFAAMLLYRKWYDSFSVSTMWQWWVSKSSSAVINCNTTMGSEPEEQSGYPA